MAEHGDQKPGSDETYELDVDWDRSEDLEEVFEQAMAAVDRGEDFSDQSDENDGAVEAAGADEGVPPPIVDPAALRMERLEKEVEGLRNRLMRTLADFENYRKRTEREKETARRFGLSEVLKEFLGVSDNLERALAASGNAEDLKSGVELIHRQLGDLLRRQGVEEVEAVGRPFDPKVHEAVLRMDRDDVDQPTVIQEMQKGFVLHDRLLRPALVTVAMPAAPPNTASPATGDGGSGESAGEGTDGRGAGTEPAPDSEESEEVVARSAETAD